MFEHSNNSKTQIFRNIFISHSKDYHMLTFMIIEYVSNIEIVPAGE